MVEADRSGRFAVIVHADVAGSTEMVQRDETLAHERIQDAFRRLGEAVRRYSGRVIELRGDALLAEFEKPSDAVSAALEFQAANAGNSDASAAELQAEVRVGIAMGEVIVADRTVTGAGVVLAQRVEQLASPGSVCITGAVHEALPRRMPFNYRNLGECQLKGFEDPVRVYGVGLDSESSLPGPAMTRSKRTSPTSRLRMAVLLTALVLGAGLVYLASHWQADDVPDNQAASMPALPEKPSIVVLPFVNRYDDGAQDYFADGITSGITTYLSKFKQLFVISNTTAVTYKGKSIPASAIAGELGVAYVLEGSVQRGAGNLSVQVQLIDAATDRHLWAEEYSVTPDEVFSLQADMIAEIVGSLSAALTNDALESVLKRPAADLESYDLYLRARAVTKTYQKDRFEEALDLLGEAIDKAPDLLEAHFELSNLHLNAWRFGRTDNAPETLRMARLHAARVLEIDQSDYRGHYLLGKLQLFADHDHDLALLSYQRAHEDNPNDTNLLYNLGFLHSLLGDGEACIEWNQRAKRVNPRYPGWYNYNAAMGHFLIGDYDQALLLAKSGMAYNSKSLAPRRVLIATLVEMGRLDDARAETEKYLAIEPGFRLSSFRNTPWKYRKDQDRYYNALRKAGIPD